MDAHLDETIDQLRHLTTSQLRSKYLELFGQPSHSHHKGYLFRRLAWRLQAFAQGGLSEHARRYAQQIAQEHVRALFLDNITDPRIMERIAKETGAAIGGTLYGDALSRPSGEADTYIRMLRHDVVTLKAGMLKN